MVPSNQKWLTAMYLHMLGNKWTGGFDTFKNLHLQPNFFYRTLQADSLIVLINFASIEQTINLSDLTDVFESTTNMEIVVAGADSSYSAG